MAIDTTRNLPSFADMLSAFKNRESLGQTLQSGLAGYEKGVGLRTAATKAGAEADYHKAQANKANAEADILKSGASKKRVPLAALPEAIKGSLASFVDAEGMVPYEAAQVALGTTEQGRKTESATKELELRQAQMEQQKKSLEENLALKQQLADLQSQLGPQAQQLAAAKAVAETSSKQKSPSLLTRGVSAVKEGLGGTPLESVLNERQGAAAQKKLSEIAHISLSSPEPQLRTAPPVAPQPTQPNPLRARAIQELQAANAPVTEANIQEAIRQLSGS